MISSPVNCSTSRPDACPDAAALPRQRLSLALMAGFAVLALGMAYAQGAWYVALAGIALAIGLYVTGTHLLSRRLPPSHGASLALQSLVAGHLWQSGSPNDALLLFAAACFALIPYQDWTAHWSGLIAVPLLQPLFSYIDPSSASAGASFTPEQGGAYVLLAGLAREPVLMPRAVCPTAARHPGLTAPCIQFGEGVPLVDVDL